MKMSNGKGMGVIPGLFFEQEKQHLLYLQPVYCLPEI